MRSGLRDPAKPGWFPDSISSSTATDRCASTIEIRREPSLNDLDRRPLPGEWTYEDYKRLSSDGQRYEVIDGVLHQSPPPCPKHQRAVLRLASSIQLHLDQTPDSGEVFVAPIDVLLPDRGTPVQPDIVYLDATRVDLIREENIVGAPNLLVEVLSPSNWIDDRRLKFELYAESGISEYWVVDPDRETVEIFRLDGGSYRCAQKLDGDESAHSEEIPGFEIGLPQIFGR